MTATDDLERDRLTRGLARYRELASRDTCDCPYDEVVSGQRDNCPIKLRYGQHWYESDARYVREIGAILEAQLILITLA